jgi:hypothetical protein
MQGVGRVAAKPAYLAEDIAIHGTDVAPGLTMSNRVQYKAFSI